MKYLNDGSLISGPPALLTERTERFTQFAIVTLLSCLTLTVFWGIRFSNSDDMFFSVTPFRTLSDYFAYAAHDAHETGRIGMWYTSVYWLISAKLWDTWLYDIALLGSVGAVLVAFLALARRLECANFALVGIIIYLSCIEGTSHFNLLLSYPFRYTSGILIFLTSLLFFDIWLERGRRRYAVAGCVLSVVAFCHHETMFAVFSCLGLLYLLWRRDTGTIRERISSAAAPFLAAIAIYLIAYIGWRQFQVVTYSGTSLHFDGIDFFDNYILAVQYYLLASLPLFHSFNGIAQAFIDGASQQYASIGVDFNIGSIISTIAPRTVLRAAVVFIGTMYAALRIEGGLRSISIVRFGIAGALAWVIPPLVISISPVYQMFVQKGYAPLHTTFFGYYGSVMLIVSMIAIALRAIPSKARRYAVMIIAAIFAIASIVADSFNGRTAEALQLNTQRWNVASLLLRHWQSSASPEALMAPQLWNYAGDVGSLPADYWHRFFLINGGHDITFSPTTVSTNGRRSEMYYNCPSADDCVVLLHQFDSDVVDVLSTSGRPRFFMADSHDGRKDFRVLMHQEVKATWLRRGTYSSSMEGAGQFFHILRPTL